MRRSRKEGTGQRAGGSASLVIQSSNTCLHPNSETTTLRAGGDPDYNHQTKNVPVKEGTWEYWKQVH